MTYTYDTTGNFTVSLTYENSCCSNTTTKVGYIDIRDKPNASFYADPESGLIPLDVQFFDTSTGRPSSWYWEFPKSQGTSTLQNPEHTYSTTGAYTVRMRACNFCGCDRENKTSYIKAGVANLTFDPANLVVPTNDTTPIELVLQVAENGLSGYFVKVFWDDSVHGLRGTGAGFCYNAGRVIAAVGPFLVGGVAARGADALDTALSVLFWVGAVPLAGLLLLPFVIETRGGALAD